MKKMKKTIRTLLLTIFIGNIFQESYARDDIQMYFTPNEECLSVIEKCIKYSTESIYVQAYSFTSSKIANYLIAAHKRGVHVEVIVDRSQINAVNTQIYHLNAYKIPIWVDNIKGLQHNKIMIFDKSRIITGSYNFSEAAENRNAENLVWIKQKRLAVKCFNNWKERKLNSNPLF